MSTVTRRSRFCVSLGLGRSRAGVTTSGGSSRDGPQTVEELLTFHEHGRRMAWAMSPADAQDEYLKMMGDPEAAPVVSRGILYRSDGDAA